MTQNDIPAHWLTIRPPPYSGVEKSPIFLEPVRTTGADGSPLKIDNDSLSDGQVLFLSDIFPTGYMVAENGQIELGDTVAVWDRGPVAQFTIQSVLISGARRPRAGPR